MNEWTPNEIRVRKAEPRGYCWCGCGEGVSPGRFFLQGHDSEAYSHLLKFCRSGRKTNDGLANVLLTLGFTDDEHGGVKPVQEMLEGLNEA